MANIQETRTLSLSDIVHCCRTLIVFSTTVYYDLPAEAARTSLQSFSQKESFSTAIEVSIWVRVSLISWHNLGSNSLSSKPSNAPSRPISLMFTSAKNKVCELNTVHHKTAVTTTETPLKVAHRVSCEQVLNSPKIFFKQLYFSL